VAAMSQSEAPPRLTVGDGRRDVIKLVLRRAIDKVERDWNCHPGHTRHDASPQTVGGDIGCGMLAVGFDVEATALTDPGIASRRFRRRAGTARPSPARTRPAISQAIRRSPPREPCHRQFG